MGEFVPRVGKSEGAKPRLKHFYGWTKYEIYGFTLGNRINILGFVIAKPCMRRGFAPSRIPTAGTTFPLDTLLFNASLFSCSRGQLYTMASFHVAREFAVVAEPICGWRYIEINAFVKTKYLHRKRAALHSI